MIPSSDDAMNCQVLCLDLIKEIVYKQILVLLSGKGGDWEEGVGGELASFFPAGCADCSFGINQSVSKVWAED